MLSFVKNGQTVATTSSGLLRIKTKSANANPFGLYICQLNASGVIFQKSVFIKEQGMIVGISSSSSLLTLHCSKDKDDNQWWELHSKLIIYIMG